MRDAVIASAVRTPAGKAPKGTLRTTRPDALAAPFCMTCGVPMRRAGSCFVCADCGATSGCS